MKYACLWLGGGGWVLNLNSLFSGNLTPFVPNRVEGGLSSNGMKSHTKENGT